MPGLAQRAGHPRHGEQRRAHDAAQRGQPAQPHRPTRGCHTVDGSQGGPDARRRLFAGGIGPQKRGLAVPHPLLDDATQWWRAYQLAEDGDDHAQRQLARWLAERGRTAEAITVIRPLADAGEDLAQLWLARWL